MQINQSINKIFKKAFPENVHFNQKEGGAKNTV